MPGRIFAIVGPSGAGKDTLIEAARRARPDLHIVRRVITRPPEAGGEPYEGVTEDEFARRKLAGEFVLDWQAHGLNYGIPISVERAMSEGRDVIFNGSRAMLGAAWEAFPGSYGRARHRIGAGAGRASGTARTREQGPDRASPDPCKL